MADEDQQVGAVDVGDRQEELVSVERPGDDLMGQLVDARGTEGVAAADRADELHAVGQSTERVHIGVAEIDPHRVRAVGRLDGGDPLGHDSDRLVPLDLDPLVSLAAHGGAQPVRVGMQIL